MAVVLDSNLTTGYTRATVANLSSNTSITGDKPSALAVNEGLLAVLHSGKSTADTITPPAGFTEIFNNQSVAAPGAHTWIGIKIAGSSEPATYSFGLTGDTKDDQLTLIRVTGLDYGNPVSVTGSGVDAAVVSPTCPSITTLSANDLAIFVTGTLSSNNLTAEDSGQPAGTTLFINKRTRSSTSGVSTGIAYLAYATPAATGTKEWTNYVTTASRTTSVSFALRAASSIALDSITPTPVAKSGTLTAVITGNVPSGSVSLTADGVTVGQTVNSWSYNAGAGKTTVVSSVVQGGIKFGAVSVKYTGGDSTVLNGTGTLAANAGSASVNISGALDIPGYIFEQMTGNYLNVDQIEYTDSPNTVVTAAGEIQQTIVRSFQARAHDKSDKTWGAFATINPGYPGTALPGGVGMVVVVGVPQVSGAATAAPGGVGGNLLVGAATGQGAGIVGVSGLSLSISVGAVSASGQANQNAVAFPLGVAMSAYVGIATAYIPQAYVSAASRTLKITSAHRKIVIQNPHKSAIWIDMQGKISTTKDPDAWLDYTFDWSDWCAECADEIVSYELIVSGDLTVTSQGRETNLITCVVSGGDEGAAAQLTCRIQTASGRRDDRTLYVVTRTL